MQVKCIAVICHLQEYGWIDWPIRLVVECSPMARETRVQSLVVVPKTQKVVLDTSLLNTQHYKVRFKGKAEQSRERSSALPYTKAIEKGAFR